MDQLTAIIGPNSSGKTAMIHALLKLFGMESKDRAIFRSEEDFEAVKKHLTMNHRQTGICKPPSDSNA